jgi:hypothetical protein
MSLSKKSRIIDCFLFNGEFDILELRLNLMYDYVDQFILVEASSTFTGIPKSDLFITESERFEEFKDKLKVITLKELPSKSDAWQNEFFMRRALLENSGAHDDDIVIISDVDEILNLKDIFRLMDYTKSYLIEMPCYYYFANLQSSEIFCVTYIGPFRKIKEKDIGNRLKFKDFVDDILRVNKQCDYGMHLTYQFGFDIERYKQKLQSFSHQEFNTEYFANNNRLRNVINFHLDLYDRWKFTYKISNETEFTSIVKDLVNALPNNKIQWREIRFSVYFLRFFYILGMKSYRDYQWEILRGYMSSIKSKFLNS